MFKKIIDFILGKEKGTPCWIVAKESNKTMMCKGMITTNLEEGLEVNYIWSDKTKHRFVAHQMDYAFEFKGLPVYLHEVGSLFSACTRFDQKIGSEYFNKIVESDIGTQMLEALEEYRNDSFPWKQLIIGIGIVVLAIFLWKSGILSELVGQFTGSVMQ